MIKDLLWCVQMSHCVTLSPNPTELLCVRTGKTPDKVTTLVIKGQFNCFFNCCVSSEVTRTRGSCGGPPIMPPLLVGSPKPDNAPTVSLSLPCCKFEEGRVVWHLGTSVRETDSNL